MADARKLVVITRPREQAEPVASLLRDRGYEPLIEPMLEVRPLPATLPPLGTYAALVFTSANGVRAFAALTPERGLPAYAVGEGTAAALSDIGFREVRTGVGNAADLAVRMGDELPPGARLLHLSGVDIARALQDLLPATVTIDRIPVYEAVAVSSLSNRLAEALYACTIGAVLLYSPRTACTFGTLIVGRGLVEKCSYVKALCLSPAVAAQAAMVPWDKIEIAASPSSEALLNLLPPLAG